MTIFLVVLSLLAALFGLPSLSNATMGVGMIALAFASTSRATVPRTSRCTVRTTAEEWCTKPTCRWTT